MSEKELKLSDEIANALKIINIEIPNFISSNLSKELREYQIKALKYYLAKNELENRGILSQNRLLFNMATGSGKTLIMAALMLECFEKGYENFIFFVNSRAILEKTKCNFTDKSSSKYLFAQNINIKDTHVDINLISNLSESKKGYINVYFTTVQSLYSLFTDERENAMSLSDLAELKLVFLADEAHHLNAETKKKLNDKEKEEKDSWEGVINKAFKSHKENLMFEFSATIPKDKSVLEKYRDKIIYEYDLAKFCKDGFAKRIYLIKYEDKDIKKRLLGGALSSAYKELIALKHNINLKPVLLFKSENIASSNENERAFNELVENLSADKIEKFYKDLEAEGDASLKKSEAFFRVYFNEGDFKKLCAFIKATFSADKIINTNNEKELEQNQILLNSLEDKDNEKRVIFSVDKLNEGWDVLNLFDIVRLGQSKTKGVTTKETQLIGRGARYYAFMSESFSEDMKFKRKFDTDLENELSELERLSYHAVNDVEFIDELNKQMKEQGLVVETDPSKTRIILKPKEKIKQIIDKDKIFYAKNEKKIKGLSGLFKEKESIRKRTSAIKVPLFSTKIIDELLDFDKKQDEERLEVFENKQVKFSVIELKYILKAMNRLNLSFELIANLGYESKRAFVEDYLHSLDLSFDKRQEFKGGEILLKIALFVLEKFKNFLQDSYNEYEASEFRAYELKMNEREILSSKKPSEKVEKAIREFEWFYYDKILKDSDLELKFLNFIEGQKEELNKAFEKWFIVRNEGFNEFKIYKTFNKKYGDEFYNEVVGFEPDFVLFAKKRGDEGFFLLQCFIEAKGAYLAGDFKGTGSDSWKEDFLKSIDNKAFDRYFEDEKANVYKELFKKPFMLKSLPFFKDLNDEVFKAAFEDFLRV